MLASKDASQPPDSGNSGNLSAGIDLRARSSSIKVGRDMQRPELQGRSCLTLKLKGFAFAIAFCLALSTGALAQKESYTPMPLGSGFGPLDTSPPPTPPDEIIKKFSTKESEFRKVYEAYGYRRSVKVQTLDGGSVDGEN